MATIFTIPLSPTPQTFKITLGGVDYRLTFTYKDIEEGGWILDIADANSVPMILGIPLVTGVDLLAQYAHMGFGGELRVQTTQDPDAVPTFDNLGIDAILYWVTP